MAQSSQGKSSALSYSKIIIESLQIYTFFSIIIVYFTLSPFFPDCGWHYRIRSYLIRKPLKSDIFTRSTDHYNLDMIISIGYRVNSIQGTQFRIWANKVLKTYLLKGCVLHQQFEQIENKLKQHDKTLLDHDQKFNLIIKTNLPPNEGVFFDGQVFDAYQFVSDLIKSAISCIVLIDNYIDDSIITLLSKRCEGVSATIYTATISKQLSLDLQRHNSQ